MAFLNSILDRPRAEKPFLLLLIGFPLENCSIPAIDRYGLNQIASWR
jgi:iodotyrosine deiodinase